MRLSASDFDAFQRATLELHDWRDGESFVKALPQIVLKLIPADHFYLLEFKLSENLRQAKVIGRIDPSGQISPELALFAETGLFDHPFSKYFVKTGDRSALKMTDFHSVHEFRRTDTYQRFYRILEIERQLAVPADFGPTTVGGMTLGRKRRDFTERDRALMNYLCPHIELAHRNVMRASTLKRLSPEMPTARELTPREAEIACWLAAGKTNPEIAFILQSNLRTVEKHVENILNKLGVENRTSAAVALVNRRDGACGPNSR